MAITQSAIRNSNGINFTYVTDSSLDWSGVTNSTYFKNLSDNLIYFKNSSGIIIPIFYQFTGGTIDSLTVTGNTTMPNRTAFSVYGAGTTSNLTTTQNGDGTLNTNNFGLTYSQGTGFDISTGIFTAPIAGLYQVTLIGRTSGFAGGISQLAVLRNNSNASGNVMMIEWAASSTMNHTGGAQIFKLSVGDTLRLKVLAGQINFDGNDNWSVAFIG